jgi:hypothetical protein
MFVVGLLLYLGETVFQNAGEGTFTVKVQKPYTDLVIEVPDCKGTDKIGVFMKKFEEAYDKKINDKKINDKKINDKKINDKKINDEKINDEKIEGRIYYLIVSGQRFYNNDPGIRDKTLADLKIGKVCTLLFGFKILENNEKATNPNEVNTEEENKCPLRTTEEEKDPSISTCPCRRVCRLCGC